VTSAVLLTAVTCAFVGPISFIALRPAIARGLLRHGAVGVGTSAALGAVLLSAADLVAQYAIPGVSMPVGIVTGAVGAFLLWLLATSKGRRLDVVSEAPASPRVPSPPATPPDVSSTTSTSRSLPGASR
jgi:iron complex transport system permease protein